MIVRKYNSHRIRSTKSINMLNYTQIPVWFRLGLLLVLFGAVIQVTIILLKLYLGYCCQPQPLPKPQPPTQTRTRIIQL